MIHPQIQNFKGTVNRTKGIISGVCLIAVGPAKGHGFDIDGKTLEQVLSLWPGQGLKAKLNHRDASGVMSICGRYQNPRISSNRVFADLHLNREHLHADWLLEAAETQPEDFGVSLTCAATEAPGSDGRKKMRISILKSADLVDDPAATSGLFLSSGEDQDSETDEEACEVEPALEYLLEIADANDCSLAEAETIRRDQVIEAGRKPKANQMEKVAAQIELQRRANPSFQPFGLDRVYYLQATGIPYSFTRQDFSADDNTLITLSAVVARGQAEDATPEEFQAAQTELSKRSAC